jgi:hypothetical protein
VDLCSGLSSSSDDPARNAVIEANNLQQKGNEMQTTPIKSDLPLVNSSTSASLDLIASKRPSHSVTSWAR